MQSKISVWLDCDPGLDDTLAIILAAWHENVNLIGVSTSAGNTSLDNTTKNALDILYNIGKKQVPVVRGSEKLIHGEMDLAEHMHGSNGLGGVDIPSSDQKPISEGNFGFIREKIIEAEGKVVWANTGALTNLCLMFRQFPEIKQKIEKIVIMGGAIGRGNITPAAEFNIYFDPFAAKEVFQRKENIPLVMIPLELTHEVKAKETIFHFLEKHEKIPFAKAIHEMLMMYKGMYKQAYDFDYPPVHDPCVINYIISPDSFTTSKCRIVVDTYQTSYGRTNCYFTDPKNPQKEIETVDFVCTQMKKRATFWATMKEIFEKIFENNPVS